MNGVDGEPDLLNVANSVPPLIGQSFTVSSVNDVCILNLILKQVGIVYHLITFLVLMST